MTIKAIATQTGVPASSYRDWEYGRKVIMNRLHVRNYFYESTFHRIQGKALKLTFAF
ncbi:MAG: hypothetical protein IPL83_12970 [Bdellovibrionales bacterium]|nr:hypothetical protein [Bdellovibrionales bacterium]